MSHTSFPSMFSTVAKLNAMHEPLRLKIIPAKGEAPVEKRANAPKAEELIGAMTAMAISMFSASLTTTLHAALLITQELSLNAIQSDPANGALIADRLRQIATMIETATPATIAAACEDRQHARELLALLAADLKTDTPPTVN